ncbi:hypothetical protein [Methylobacterium sp. PvR107]|uniref:hypothetical protein n=1 Tax=Methylobacterium sp. PvR107 TaxID=2806597 RepID=UPI001AE8D240|nr:hypothetical protein [Methylobacterium sp. PvR107]MBP1179997.1 hypothetical protein [Methylobacterium sp. PvR107]
MIETGAAYPQSYCETMPAAEARVVELLAERGGTWRIIPCDDWTAEREASYLDKPAAEITAERFDDMLNCLPPVYCGSGDCDFRFNMSEFQFGRITEQFARIGDRYFSKYVRHGDAATYITAEAAR